MLKRKRTGLIVWGSIFTVYGLVLFINGLVFSIQGTQYMWLMALGGLVLTVGGAAMLGFGILNAVKTTKYNNEIMSHSEVYCTNCIYCSRPITCALKDFKAHKNYPEGFIYCPFCKRPVSKSKFNIISP